MTSHNTGTQYELSTLNTLKNAEEKVATAITFEQLVDALYISEDASSWLLMQGMASFPGSARESFVRQIEAPCIHTSATLTQSTKSYTS